MVDQHIRNRLKDRIVGIAGCGGLGSNCAVALARVGIGKLIIADFDRVEESNLNRQYFFSDQVGMAKAVALRDNIARIDPSIKVEAHEIMLDPENIPDLYAGCDVLVEAFDKAEMKQMLMETFLETEPAKYLVCGVGLAGWGQSHRIGLHQFDNIYICGDMALEVTPEFPPLAPRVGIVANMQANQVLELLLGQMHHDGNHIK